MKNYSYKLKSSSSVQMQIMCSKAVAVDLYAYMVDLYAWTEVPHNKWLIYILGESIYPVHG